MSEFAKGNTETPKEGTGIPWTNTAMGAETGKEQTFELDPKAKAALLAKWKEMKARGLTEEDFKNEIAEELLAARALIAIREVQEDKLDQLLSTTPKIPRKDILLIRSLFTSGSPEEK